MSQLNTSFAQGDEALRSRDSIPGNTSQTPPSPIPSSTTPTSSRGTFDPRHDKSSEGLIPDKHTLQQPLSRLSSRSEGDQPRTLDLEKQDRALKAPQNEQVDPNLVVWNGPDDPENPYNMPHWRKWLITAAMGGMTLCITFASSVFSTAINVTSEEFGVSTVVMTLGTALFVLGFSFGPLVWGPISELYGRKIPLFIGYIGFAIFTIPVGVAQNLQTIFICRFLGGVFGSSTLAVLGGALADFWDPVNRGIAVAVFAGSSFIGPVLGPILGGFITMSHLGWRWTAWITLIMAALFGTLGYFIIPETYAPVLLKRRAKRLRFETKNWALHAKSEEDPVNLKSITERYMLRPFKMMIMEPILILVTIYMGLIYGIMYLFFSAYPIAFQEYRGWNGGVGGLPFIALMIGVICGCLLIAYTSKTSFKRALEREGRVIPEARLLPMIVGAFVFPAGMFWFGWTSNPNITWVPQVIAGIPIGMGLLLIFLQGLNYIIDVYGVNANSAIAGNTFVRSSFGAGFPMFAAAMYHKLGVSWASSLLAFLTVLLIPLPILFLYFGAKIRKMSRYTPDN